MVGLSATDAPQNAQTGQDQLAAGVHAGAGALQERRLRPRQPLHPQGHHSGRLPGFRREADRLQALQRRDEGAGKAKAAGGGDGRGAHDAFENLLKYCAAALCGGSRAVFGGSHENLCRKATARALTGPPIPRNLTCSPIWSCARRCRRRCSPSRHGRKTACPTSARTPGRCFHGDRTAFFACMGNLYQHTHTYANILPRRMLLHQLSFLAALLRR